MSFSFDTEHPVFLFAHEGNLDALREALSAEPALAKRRASNGSSLLHFASESGHFMMVQWLLSEGGSKIDERNQHGNTALLFAASQGHLELVQWLLTEGGSKIDERNQYGNTALLRAASQGHLELVQWLLSEGGSRINERNQYGNTALINAAYYGHLEVVQWLLSEGGSRINETNKNGNTALLIAANHGHLEVVQWLLSEGGSKIDERNQFGDTALVFAVSYGHIEVVKWLLRHKDISYRALLSVSSQTDLILDEAAQALITAKIESYELCIKRAKSDVPGFVFQETETHVLIKDELFCPISYELIEEPVVAADGVLYDKKHIEKWFNEGHDTSPITGKKLEHNFIVPEISRQKELDDIHQAIERLYQQVRKRKSAFTSSEHIRKRSKSLPPLTRFFNEAAECDLMSIAGPASAYITNS